MTEVNGASDWYAYEVRTPAHRFLNIVKWFSEKELCCEFTARDSFPAALLTGLLSFTDENVSELSCEKRITKLSQISRESSFTAVAYINCESHNAFKSEVPLLHPRTLVAFPVHDCEFSGDESAEQIQCMRSDFVATINWNREPAPKILMRYDNRKTRSKSIGKKLKLAGLATVMNEITNLQDAPESFIEIANYKHQQCLIVSKGSTNHISIVDLELSLPDTVNFVNRFIRYGINGPE